MWGKKREFSLFICKQCGGCGRPTLQLKRKVQHQKNCCNRLWHFNLCSKRVPFNVSAPYNSMCGLLQCKVATCGWNSKCLRKISQCKCGEIENAKQNACITTFTPHDGTSVRKWMAIYFESHHLQCSSSSLYLIFLLFCTLTISQMKFILHQLALHLIWNLFNLHIFIYSFASQYLETRARHQQQKGEGWWFWFAKVNSFSVLFIFLSFHSSYKVWFIFAVCVVALIIHSIHTRFIQFLFFHS